MVECLRKYGLAKGLARACSDSRGAIPGTPVDWTRLEPSARITAQ